MKKLFCNVNHNCNRKPSLNETNDRKEFENKILADFLIHKGIIRCSRYIYLRAVFAEFFISTLEDIPKIPISEKDEMQNGL